MKKITLIILLIIGLSSCKEVNQTNVTDVDYSIVLEAGREFYSDSTKNVAIINKGGYNYVFERNIKYPILKSYTNYNSNYLTIFIITAVFSFIFLIVAITIDLQITDQASMR